MKRVELSVLLQTKRSTYGQLKIYLCVRHLEVLRWLYFPVLYFHSSGILWGWHEVSLVLCRTIHYVELLHLVVPGSADSLNCKAHSLSPMWRYCCNTNMLNCPTHSVFRGLLSEHGARSELRPASMCHRASGSCDWAGHSIRWLPEEDHGEHAGQWLPQVLWPDLHLPWWRARLWDQVWKLLWIMITHRQTVFKWDILTHHKSSADDFDQMGEERIFLCIHHRGLFNTSSVESNIKDIRLKCLGHLTEHPGHMTQTLRINE